MKRIPRSFVQSVPIVLAAGLVVFAFGFIAFTGDYQDDGVVGWTVQSVLKSSGSLSCLDSDDGKNFEERGVITFTRKNTEGKIRTQKYPDYCNGPYLNEYYCLGTQKNFDSVRKRCVNGCLAGACA